MGHTQKMAEAVYDGAASATDEAHLLAIEGADITEGRWQNDEILAALGRSDAIIFGSPTYMGSISGQMKAFLDATAELYFDRAWEDKVAAAFTVSGGLSGDKQSAFSAFVVCAMQLGMIWVGQARIPYNEEGINRLGLHLGAAGQAMQEPPAERPNAEDKETGRLLGVRVAEVTKRLVG